MLKLFIDFVKHSLLALFWTQTSWKHYKRTWSNLKNKTTYFRLHLSWKMMIKVKSSESSLQILAWLMKINKLELDKWIKYELMTIEQRLFAISWSQNWIVYLVCMKCSGLAVSEVTELIAELTPSCPQLSVSTPP